MHEGLLKARRRLVDGIASKHSIAAWCSMALRTAGGELAVTCAHEKSKLFTAILAATLYPATSLSLDVHKNVDQSGRGLCWQDQKCKACAELNQRKGGFADQANDKHHLDRIAGHEGLTSPCRGRVQHIAVPCPMGRKSKCLGSPR